MASPRQPTTMENLPGDVLSDIFIRLLAKQLAQMRCVCKPWNALLSESSFIKSHLHRSKRHNDEILLFFLKGFSFDCMSLTACPSHSSDLQLTNFINTPVNPQSKSNRGNVVGSVNGLICFSYGSYHKDVVIWNPSLSAVLTLPPFSLRSRYFRKIHYRFGFDPKTDDYKVVKLTSLFNPCGILPQVEVYSMKKGSWELISQRFPSHISTLFDHDEVCVDGHEGHLHWLGYSTDTDLVWKRQTIVAFDLGAETFREIPLPDSIPYYRPDGYHFSVLGVSAGKLCVISKKVDDECEVWVMNEYGVADSWVKHHVLSWFGSIRPYGFTSHNEFVLRVHGCFDLYDPIAAKTKSFMIRDRHYRTGTIKIVEYVDSLVWVAPAKREMSCCGISQLQI